MGYLVKTEQKANVESKEMLAKVLIMFSTESPVLVVLEVNPVKQVNLELLGPLD